MVIDSHLMSQLTAIQMPAKAFRQVIEALSGYTPPPSKDAQRKRRQRERERDMSRKSPGQVRDTEADKSRTPSSPSLSPPTPPSHPPPPTRESVPGASAQAQACEAQAIIALYPRRDSPRQCLEAVLDDLTLGQEPEEMKRLVRLCAEHIAKAPGGGSNRYVPNAETFFGKRQWLNPEAFAERWKDRVPLNGHGNKKALQADRFDRMTEEDFKF